MDSPEEIRLFNDVRYVCPHTDRASCDQLPSRTFRFLDPGHTRGAGQPGHTRSGAVLERIAID
jgi:hypothetical protein